MEHEHKITEKHRALFAQLLKEGTDPVSFWCSLLSDESAPLKEREEAARELRPYYHPWLAQMGPFLQRFGK
jgi:hypothetical protein